MTSESKAHRCDTKMMKADSRQSQKTQASDTLFGNMPTTSTEFYIDSHKQEPRFHRKKSQVARPETTIVGQKLTYDGRLPDTSKISKILKWPIPRNMTEARGFLGL